MTKLKKIGYISDFFFGPKLKMKKKEKEIIGNFLRKYGSTKAKSRRGRGNNKDHLFISKEPSYTIGGAKSRISYLCKLNLMSYTQKTKGAFTRSRAKWLEEGEHIIFLIMKNTILIIIILID